MADTPLRVRLEQENRVLRLTLSRPKANIIDTAMLYALQSALAGYRDSQALSAVLIDAEGPHFSFGASVEEHLPGQYEKMLKNIGQVALEIVSCPVPVLVAVRGLCLGGGMEIACAGSMIFAAEDAGFGQPEIQVGVFAPLASCLLPERIGRARAEDLLFSGRTIRAEEALRIGLAHAVEQQPEQAAMAYIEEHLLPHSSFVLRHAVQAARTDYIARIREKLSRVEQQYRGELMSGHDPEEGLQAFMEKRRPQWKNR